MLACCFILSMYTLDSATGGSRVLVAPQALRDAWHAQRPKGVPLHGSYTEALRSVCESVACEACPGPAWPASIPLTRSRDLSSPHQLAASTQPPESHPEHPSSSGQFATELLPQPSEPVGMLEAPSPSTQLVIHGELLITGSAYAMTS